MQLAVAAVPVASLPMPCDVMDFLSHSALLQDDLAMLILTAAIREPLPVGALVEAWNPIPRESQEGRFVIPHDAKSVFKTHCDCTFGGEVWFNVLNQMGGCPAEFVDAYNTVIDQRLAAINRPLLGKATTPRARDLLEPFGERPRFMKSRVRQLKHQAAQLAKLAGASTPGDGDQSAEIARLLGEAAWWEELRMRTMEDLDRAATHPATHHTAAASGAQPDEPRRVAPDQFTRALRRTLLQLNVPSALADRLVTVDAGVGDDEGGWDWTTGRDWWRAGWGPEYEC